MNKLEKVLISIFFIILLIYSGIWIYKIIQLRWIKINTEIKVVNKVKTKYISYNNKTSDNIWKLNSDVLSMIYKLKDIIIDKNKELDKSDKLKSDYFDFYAKYMKNISFIEYLTNKNNVYLQDFEKKILLWRLEKSKKLINALNLKEVKYDIKWTYLWKNKKIVYNKNNHTVRIQSLSDDKWKNIYFGKLEFYNINNEYVYKIDFINDKTNKQFIHWIVYTLKKNMYLQLHFFNIELKDWIIKNIYNKDNSNRFIWIFNSKECNLNLRYLYITNDHQQMNFVCYDIYKKKNIEKNIIDLIWIKWNTSQSNGN